MSKQFRTIESSFPQFEKDGLRFFTVKSKNLKGRGDICVFVPSSTAPDIPVVILLHGVYGSAWSWALNGGVHLTAQKMMEEKLIPPMILAMPSDGLWGDGSGYVPHDGFDFSAWIAHDVPAILEECYLEVSSTSPYFICGLSMGGFGALMTGVNHPGRFKAISVHSSMTNIGQMKLFAEEDTAHYRQADTKNEDCLEAILSHREHLPAIRFDCGRDDLLIDHNRQLHRGLSDAGITHEYKEFEGGHEWPYWQEHVKDSLRFFTRQLSPEQRG